MNEVHELEYVGSQTFKDMQKFANFTTFTYLIQSTIPLKPFFQLDVMKITFLSAELSIKWSVLYINKNSAQGQIEHITV